MKTLQNMKTENGFVKAKHLLDFFVGKSIVEPARRVCAPTGQTQRKRNSKGGGREMNKEMRENEKKTKMKRIWKKRHEKRKNTIKRKKR